MSWHACNVVTRACCYVTCSVTTTCVSVRVSLRRNTLVEFTSFRDRNYVAQEQVTIVTTLISRQALRERDRDLSRFDRTRKESRISSFKHVTSDFTPVRFFLYLSKTPNILASETKNRWTNFFDSVFIKKKKKKKTIAQISSGSFFTRTWILQDVSTSKLVLREIGFFFFFYPL